MTDAYILSTCFVAGVVGHSAYYVRSKTDLYLFFGLLVITSFFVWPSDEVVRATQIVASTLVGAGLYSFIFALVLRENILQFINERTLLEYTLLAHYIIWTREGALSGDNFIGILILLSIPTLAVLSLAITSWVPPRWFKLCMYIWFLIINLIFLFSFHSLGEMEEILQSEVTVDHLGFCIASGAVFFSLVMNLAYLYDLLPIPGKRQSFRERLRDVKEHIDILISRFEETQIRMLTTLSILALIGSVLALNLWLKIIADQWIVNILLIVLSLVSHSLVNEERTKQ